MEKLLILYVVNLILDYPLQGTFLAEFKSKNNYILFVHCAIWAFGLSVVLMPLGLFAWWKVVMLLIGHITLIIGNVEVFIRNGLQSWILYM